MSARKTAPGRVARVAKPPRPAPGPDVLRARGFVQWFREHPDPKTNDTPLERALWFLAYVEAEDAMDGNTAKDWARLFIDGMPGFKTLSDVQRELDAYKFACVEEFPHKSVDEAVQVARGGLETMLDAWMDEQPRG